MFVSMSIKITIQVLFYELYNTLGIRLILVWELGLRDEKSK